MTDISGRSCDISRPSLPERVKVYLPPRRIFAGAMTDFREKARFREHLAELSHSMKLIGHDVAIEGKHAGHKIDKAGKDAGEGVRDAMYDVEDGLTDLGHEMKEGAKNLPENVDGGLSKFGQGFADGAASVGVNTAVAIEEAGHAARKGTRNAFARASGLKKKPVKEWHSPDSE